MATEYEIKIPGAKQIFRFAPPSTLSQEAKQALIQRSRDKSPVPGFLQWIPGVINVLDDAQDILITGLTLAKPLLRRLPLRFVPVLGWVLLANDILNISTAILATGIGGAFPKKIAKNVMEFYAKARFNPTGGTKAFFGKTNKLSFALQAAQASQTITGYGLSLGGIMGMITDTVWGTLRVLQGNKVTIKGPPPDDIFGKAGRFLIQTFGWDWSSKILTKEQEMTVLCAKKIAIDMITEGSEVGSKISRMSQADSVLVPNVRPYIESSRRALIAEGIDPDVDQFPLSRVADTKATFGDVIAEVNQHHLESQMDLKTMFGATEEAVVNQCVMDEAGIFVTEWLQPEEKQYQYDFTLDQSIVLRSYEMGLIPAVTTYEFVRNRISVMPGWTLVIFHRGIYSWKRRITTPVEPTPEQVELFAIRVKFWMDSVGASVPSIRNIRSAMTDVWGGWIEVEKDPRTPTEQSFSPVRL